MRLVIAARQSALARLQAYKVGQALQDKNPSIEIDYHFRSSLGDQNANDPLWKMPEKGVFTEDFHGGLMEGQWDMVVHSWKDLPVENRQGSLIAATLPREDARDLLLVKKEAFKTQNFIKFEILTSSPRRAYNLGRQLKDLLPFSIKEFEFVPVRGNIQTRFKKFLEQKEQGFVVAKAAMDRLLSAEGEEFAELKAELQHYLSQVHWMVLPLSLNPPAAAQGALAIEIKSDREDLKNILTTVNCSQSFKDVEDERRLLKSWGGGCHQKIGVSVLTRPYGRVTIARGVQDTGETIYIDKLDNNMKAFGSYFPDRAEQQTWFQRQQATTPSHWQEYDAHWVSRSEALPNDIQLNPEKHILWTSGLKTWSKLAKRGYWVNGSSESLGEQETPRIESLDSTSRKWCKWTHNEGADFVLGDVLNSYQLIPKADRPQLNPETDHFYWMSGSSFLEAIKHYPWLLDKHHWSGPGHTYEYIKRILNDKKAHGSVSIALGLEQWHNMFKKGNSDDL